MSARKAKTGDRTKSASNEQYSNSGAKHEDGYLFHHVVLSGGKHIARYERSNDERGALFCSVCMREV